MTSAPLQRARGCSAGTLLGAARTVSGAFAGPLARPLAPTRHSLRDSSLRARERITLRGHLIAMSYRGRTVSQSRIDQLAAFTSGTLASVPDGARRSAAGGGAVQNSEILARIDELVAQEHRLRSQGQALTDEERAALRDAEVHLDQLWDLLRRRDAARRAGQDPDSVAGERPAGEGESSLQCRSRDGWGAGRLARRSRPGGVGGGRRYALRRLRGLVL